MGNDHTEKPDKDDNAKPRAPGAADTPQERFQGDDIVETRAAMEEARKNGEALLKAAARGHEDKVRAILEDGFGALTVESGTGATPLHVAAASGAREIVRLLLGNESCLRMLLVRDHRGRLPSDYAHLYAHDAVLARYLAMKAGKRAAELGIAFTHKPLKEKSQFDF